MKKSLANFVFSVAALALLTSCASSANNVPASAPAPQVRMVDVSYLARASQPFDDRLPSAATVTYSTATGIQQHSIGEQLNNSTGTEGIDIRVPAGTPFSISVQNSKKTGLVICAVYVDGEQVSKNFTSTGYGIASCTGVAR